MNVIMFDQPFVEDKENYHTKIETFHKEHDILYGISDITESVQRYAIGITDIMGCKTILEVYLKHLSFQRAATGSTFEVFGVDSVCTIITDTGSTGCILNKSNHTSMESALRVFCQETAKLTIQCNPPTFSNKFMWDEDDLPEVKNPAKRHRIK